MTNVTKLAEVEIGKHEASVIPLAEVSLRKEGQPQPVLLFQTAEVAHHVR